MRVLPTLFPILLIFSSFQTTYTYNYLVFCPLFAHSHTTFFANIADSLTDAGHNVTFFIPTIVRKYESRKYTESTKDVVHLKANDELAAAGELVESADFARFWDHDSSYSEILPTVKLFRSMFENLAQNLEKNLDVLDDLKSRNFDVMIYEVFIYCAHPVREYLGIKTITPALSLTHLKDFSQAIGEPVNPSYLPSAVSPFGDNMTFSERFFNTVGERVFRSIVGFPVVRSFIPPFNTFDISAEEAKCSFAFMNSNPFLDFPKPTIAKTVQIGGISVNVEKIRKQKLDESYEKILNQRPKNVIIAFGTITLSKDMPFDYKSNILQVIASFPNVTFIWKYENETVPQLSDKKLENVMFDKWIPQTALLADDRVSAFISQGGLGSVNELCYLGKPAIIVPLYADQMRNSKMLIRHNTSIFLSKYDLPKFEELRNAVERILNDESYTKNAVKLRRILELQPIKPIKLLVKHAEFAAEFGELTSLDPHLRTMSSISYHLIDVFMLLFFILIVMLCIFVITVKLLVRLIRFFIVKHTEKRYSAVETSLSQ